MKRVRGGRSLEAVAALLAGGLGPRNPYPARKVDLERLHAHMQHSEDDTERMAAAEAKRQRRQARNLSRR